MSFKTFINEGSSVPPVFKKYITSDSDVDGFMNSADINNDLIGFVEDQTDIKEIYVNSTTMEVRIAPKKGILYSKGLSILKYRKFEIDINNKRLVKVIIDVRHRD